MIEVYSSKAKICAILRKPNRYQTYEKARAKNKRAVNIPTIKPTHVYSTFVYRASNKDLNELH